jgi:hypothetical protein
VFVTIRFVGSTFNVRSTQSATFAFSSEIAHLIEARNLTVSVSVMHLMRLQLLAGGWTDYGVIYVPQFLIC